ncbi:hypothetical protein DESC_830037 [Desulfosarcina cetonica]|nr:hypothetical protein DESC_830037 [Desulfosarcina cetonica]
MVGATEGASGPLGRLQQKLVAQGPAGKAHGALDDHQVFGLGIQVGLLEGRIGIALVGGHEAGAHLHPAGTHFEEAPDVGAIVDTAGGDHRDAHAVFGLDLFHFGQHIPDQVLQAEGRIVQLLGLEAQVPAGLGTFHDKGIGQVAVTLVPAFSDDRRGPARADDGYQAGTVAFFEKTGKIQWQSGAGEDQVDFLGDGGLDHLGEMGQGDHDVDADDPGGFLLGFSDFAGQGPTVGLQAVGGDILFGDAGHGAGDDADSAGIGYGRSQIGHGDPHPHATLDNWKATDQVADFKFRHFHG